MPHAVLKGVRPLSDFVADLAPATVRVGGCVLKLERVYVDPRGGEALLSALTVQGDLRQQFFILLHERRDGLTVRLHPLTDPEKTLPVRLALAAVVRRAQDLSPGAWIGPTNLEPALEVLAAAAAGDDRPAGGAP